MFGQIIAVKGNHYTIYSGSTNFEYEATISRKLPMQNETIVAVGDKVEFQIHNESDAIITSVEQRERKIARLLRHPKDFVQVIATNIDQLFIVVTWSAPIFRSGMVDRFLVIGLRESIPVTIIVNKIDLTSEPPPSFKWYQENLPVLHCSCQTGKNIEQVKALLTGKTTVLIGQSGVGKSSLINAIVPQAPMKTAPLRLKVNKGRHTTTISIAFPMPQSGLIIDTPGIRHLMLEKMDTHEWQWYFPEFRPHANYCQFNDCLHLEEPRCGVKEAVAQGIIHPGRYQTYQRLLNAI